MESLDDLPDSGYIRYLLFVLDRSISPVQLVLWIADNSAENHKKILTASGLPHANIEIAGEMIVSLDKVNIGAAGSSSADFLIRKDPKPVVELVSQLPGNKHREVVST
jgi:hypothetical protein